MTSALLPEQDDADELRDDAADAEAQQVGVLLRVPPKRAAKMAARLWTALDGPRAERCLAAVAARPWAVATLERPSALSIPAFAWAERDAVRPDDPEAALAAAAHALFQRAAQGEGA